MLEVKQLTCQRDNRILFSELSFSLAPQQCLFVQGTNGCGKTTLLRALCGLFPPETGNISWQQKILPDNRDEFRNDLLYIGHQNGVKSDLTVFENLQALCGFTKTHSHRDLQAALSQIGLQGYYDVLAQHLSRGQQRRVALARLLLASERLWILDEPFAALDSKGVALITTAIKQHLSGQGMVIITSHQPLPILSSIENVNLKTINLNEK